jgi:mRNA interferase MazF
MRHNRVIAEGIRNDTVSQVTTVDKSQLVEYMGKSSRRRVRQILDGIRLLMEPRDLR